jgi:aldose sugar dehydrogenase
MKNRVMYASRAGSRLHAVSCLSAALLAAGTALPVTAQPDLPQMIDHNLAVRQVVGGLVMPTTMAFLNEDQFFVLEKNTGRVQLVSGGVVQGTVLDLAVNFGSERGLLGIALHPQFSATGWVYLYWTESTSGLDTNALSQTSLRGNRVDRYIWNGATLTHDINLIRIRAIQEDAGQPARGNHDGGVLRFGPDGKLYIYIGDVGRRGQMQNLPDGPGPAGNQPDDQFGGPEPDDAHLTGVILRLNDDGTTPADNPFFAAAMSMFAPGEARDNLQKVFAYGLRNGFGMAFDPFSGRLWEAQNADDAFTELNRVEAGANLGWIQIMGPLSRIAQFREIETTMFGGSLQQVRWPPVNIATNASDALERMFKVYDGGNEFAAVLTGAEEVPPVTTTASGVAHFILNGDGTVSFKLAATGPITNATAAHIHLGAYAQNGPVAVTLFSAATPQNFVAGDVIASGTITDAEVTARPAFAGTVADLVRRIRQQRTYVNLHTTANPPGEIRGQIVIIDRDPVSHYRDPEFSWKFEVAPAGVGFISSRALGPQYQGDLVIGAARDFLLDGHLFRLNLTGNRLKIGVDDPRLEDRVADNLAKFEITESETLLFGTGFGVGTDIQTGPNGNLYVVSLSLGAVYEIFRLERGR